MDSYMVFTYGTDTGKDVNVRIPNVKVTLNEFAVDAAMGSIYTANALHPKHGNLTSKKKAVQYTVDTIELDVL